MSQSVTLKCRVSGVTYEGRQDKIPQLLLSDPVRLEPEPTNPYDPNAIKVLIAHAGEIWHMGYVPKELAKTIAPHLEGEACMARIVDITGGFKLAYEDRANYGLIISVEIPATDWGYDA